MSQASLAADGPTTVVEPPSEDDTSDEDAETELSRDDLFFALSNRRRRFILHHMLQTGESATLRDLSAETAAWENDVEPEETTSAMRKRAYVSLRQTHLPKMDELGLLEYDGNRGVARLTDRVEDLEIYLEVTRGREFPWSRFYLGLGVLLLTVTVALWANVPIMRDVPTIGYIAGFAVVLTVGALVHTRQNRRQLLGADHTPPGPD